MKKVKQPYFLIDFDSTFIQKEGLDELANIALKSNKNHKSILREIQNLTNQGMNGEIPFDKSLLERIKLLSANSSHVKQTVNALKQNISSSILRNKMFFETNKDTIFIISGGFKELIIPVVQSFGLSEKNVYANTFIFDELGNITGIDTANPLAGVGGKAKIVQSLQLDGEIYAIGDGYTDYQLKELGLAKHFIAFTENISREQVVNKADFVAGSFDEFLKRIIR